ncbi:uncharacterized protein LOC108089353 [Drosophila ficusphila]|uniref:uncharacterized protein LOC108089353 n=1 Tax=Drosophila ficusphila TaxID=30025 RepID=UPI001C89E01E|nr:uncharacterized protein LOC108089353 [Drosophila ficusphila]
MTKKVCCLRPETFGVVIGCLSSVASTFATTMLPFFLAARVIELTIGVILLLLLVTNIVTSFILSIAILKKQYHKMLPWLIDSGLLLFFLTILGVYGLIMFIHMSDRIFFIIYSS